jgi:hypothetical protein
MKQARNRCNGLCDHYHYAVKSLLLKATAKTNFFEVMGDM